MRKPLLAAALLSLLAGACAVREPMKAVQGPASRPTQAAVSRPSFIALSRLVPELDGTEETQGLEPDGTRRVVFSHMRLVQHPNGSIERAPGLLPAGRTKLITLELPSRLGGGFVFVASGTASAQLWKASSWLAPLQPFARVNQIVQDAAVGFDRLYLRTTRPAEGVLALDVDSGRWAGLGSLPLPHRYGPMWFADSWRAVVVTDVRGPMATFDAGASWFPVRIAEPISSLGSSGDRIEIQGAFHAYVLGTDGSLTSSSKRTGASSGEQGRERSTLDKPLGESPLRLGLERGYPLTDRTALVAHQGKLAEVDVRSGHIERLRKGAFGESYAQCTGLALGTGIGFVCGERQGATTVFAYEEPLQLRAVMHWAEPKVVMSSGNGAIVARAGCPGMPERPGQRAVCVRDAKGALQELHFQGEAGAERVVGLADGRAAVVVAPRPGALGQLVLIEGQKLKTLPLSFGALSQRQKDLALRGLWLDGAQEIAPGVLGLWVEAGGPLMGLHVDLSGQVKAGPVQYPTGAAALSGRFGLLWGSGGTGQESTDGGLHWSDIELPSGTLARTAAVRGCSAVGCVMDNWLRVGWGKPLVKGDLDSAPAPTSVYPPFRLPTPKRLVCSPTGRSSPAPLPLPKPVQLPQAKGPRPGTILAGLTSNPAWQNDPRVRGWVPFASAPVPTLSADEVGIGAGHDYGDFRYRAYAWGPKGGDWSRAGRWLVRFDSLYEPLSPPRSTLAASSPWSELSIAQQRIGSVTGTALDPGGKAAVIGWVSSSNQSELYGLLPQEPPVPFSTSDPMGFPMVRSVVHTEEGWLLLGIGQDGSSWLWSVDSQGQGRKLRQYQRQSRPAGDSLELTRRAKGPGVALQMLSVDASGSPSRVLFPLEPSTGEILDVMELGAEGQEGRALPHCAPEQDGWLVEGQLAQAPELLLPNGTNFSTGLRAVMRLQPGASGCIEALAANGHVSESVSGRIALGEGESARAIPLSLWDDSDNRKHELLCVEASGP